MTPHHLQHLKTGDIVHVHTPTNTPIRFKIMGADIIHHSRAYQPSMPSSIALTLSANYPFGRRCGDTPLRYMVYAALAG